ncbi:MAG: UTP--glucose-1-phosphate uridylyltransferase [Deltaproteobacteria bacterium]|nr:UTP--glucose-1-phosphate uridylyltransferase [Deltaproteobacteria bacterium]
MSSSIAEILASHGQSHLVAHLQSLPAGDQAAFSSRLSHVDWEELQHPSSPPAVGEIGPSRVVDFAERARRHNELTAAGEACLRAGQAAVLMVAGGQGTRLGSSAPKGCFAITPHTQKSIYQIQAEKVLSLSRRCGRDVPFLVMTSPMTDAETRAFFAEHQLFGLAPEQVRFFSQGTVPSLDKENHALLAGPGRLLENPDGHGGCFTALVKSGNLERLAKEGVTQIVYIQVDNILAPVDDPLLLGLATVERSDVITKVLEKAHPDEKVGHLVRVGNADQIIEYTEVTPEQTRTRNTQGELIYRWGSPAMHCWSVSFLHQLAGRGFKLPLHRSAKPLNAWQDGQTVSVPGWKSERFIFDLIPQAKTSLGLQINRDDEFAPVKNASGDDSPQSAQRIAHNQYVRWFEAAGVKLSLPPTALIEVSPLFAATQEQFLARWDNRVSEISGDYSLQA